MSRNEQTSPRSISKACDQCYRCKVRCEMDGSSCMRCRSIQSPCTYSLGKWMGRPKKTSRVQSTREKRTRTHEISTERHNSFNSLNAGADQNVTDWDMMMYDDSGFLDFDTVASSISSPGPSSYPLSDEGCFSVDSGPLDMRYLDSMLSSPVRSGNVSSLGPPDYTSNTQSKGSVSDMALAVEPVSTFVLEDREHLPGDDNNPPATPCTRKGGSTEATPSPPALDRTSSISSPANAHHRSASLEKVSRPSQISQCNCSASSLTCLETLSTVDVSAGSEEVLQALECTLSTVEDISLCTACPSQLLIMKCCIALERSQSLVASLSSAVLGSSANIDSPPRATKATVPRLKRRAAILFAGLAMLQGTDGSSKVSASVQAEYITELARAWNAIPEC